MLRIFNKNYKKNMIANKNNIDTGKIIAELITNSKISKSELGRSINRNGLSVLYFTRNSSIQTSILIDVCYALNHNIFSDIADMLPKSFSKADLDGNVTKENLLIAELQEENKVLKIQNDIMQKALGIK